MRRTAIIILFAVALAFMGGVMLSRRIQPRLVPSPTPEPSLRQAPPTGSMQMADDASQKTHRTNEAVEQPTFTDEDFESHIAQLRRAYPMDGMTVVVEAPFVVVGNEAPAKVRRRAAVTVRWATQHFRKDFFRRDPDHIITLWLLGDAESYAVITQAVTGRAPTTPYGFYLQSKAALVMNIATGSGTLVHEMFHAFVSTNFPDMPPWVNEGLASLYEQCGERDGQIVGYTNWRLAGLKKAIHTGKTLPLKDLCSLSAEQFYGRGSGIHYAQARYLFYYLQEQGLLRTFYTAFEADRREDPSGYATLLKTLDVDDADAFLQQWQKWCLGLKFPG